MKFKYFLRGLGIGIIFSAVVMLAAFLTSGDRNLSDDEIISRAEKLGMIMKDDAVISATDSDAENVKANQESEDAVADKELSGSESTEPASDAVTTEASKATAGEPEDKNTEAGDKEDSYVTVKITVTSGMTSTRVAELLQDAGIIDDYHDFDAYLNEKGYSTQIRVKTCELNNKMTYEEIAEELIKEASE